MKRLILLLTFVTASFTLFAQSVCTLSNFAYDVKVDGDLFYIYFSAPYDLTDNYLVFVNEELQEFNGDLLYGPFKADCETPNTIKVININDESCSVSASIGSVCPSTDECRIGNIEFSYPECNPNGVVYIDLNFEYANVSDSFYLKGNGNFYGTYSYSNLPISVGPFVGDCDKELEFVVIDSEVESCKNDVGGIVICCPWNCVPPAFEIVEKKCDGVELFMKLVLLDSLYTDNISILINQQYINSFELDYPYIYLETNLTQNSIVNTIVVCTNGIFDACCYEQTFTVEDCIPNDECKIYDLRYHIPDCQEFEEVFLEVDFKHVNTSSDSFIVRGNGINYGTFAYASLPVKIGPFQSACDVLYELAVYDSEAEDCGDVLESINICCHQGCLEPIFEVLSVDCHDEGASVKLELIHPLTTNSIQVYYNNVPFDNYEIDYPYVYLRLNQIDSSYSEITICYTDPDGSQCCYSMLLDIDCNPNNECKISEITATPDDCIDAGLPGFIIDFEYSNVGSEGFSLKGNGHDYGDFKYEELPIHITVEDNCDQFYEFVVIDNEFDCFNYLEYGHFCCSTNCSFRIYDKRARCEDGILTEVAFFLEEDTDPIKSYEVFINGEFIGETQDNNVFLEFETNIPLSGGDGVELTICDSDCCITEKLDVSECVDPPQSCEISKMSVREVSCGDQGLNFILDFDHVGTSSNTFDVFSILGYFGTFEYSELPLKIENYPNINIGLNVVFVCDQGSFCCQVHLFDSPSCQVFGDDETAFIEDLPVNKKYRYIQTNPSKGELTLRSPYPATRYQLLDSSGRLIRSLRADELEAYMDISDVMSGMYILRIEHLGEIKIEKLIIAN